MESCLSSTDGKHYCQIHLRLMTLLKQKPFPHQSNGNAISQQALLTWRLSPFLLVLLLHCPVLGALPRWHSSPLLLPWQKWCSILLAWEVTPVLLIFSVILTIPKANDLRCSERGDALWGFASTPLDRVAHPQKGDAVVHNKTGCSSVLLTEKSNHDKRHVGPLKLENIWLHFSDLMLGLSPVSRLTQRIWARYIC